MQMIIGIIVAYIAMAAVANATDSICEAIATKDSAKTETNYPLRKGDVIGAITQYRVDKSTKETSYCSHGGGCYAADVLRLTNCIVDKKPQEDDEDATIYGLTLLRDKVPPDKLRQHDVELRLLNMGLCNGCAGNAADYYVKKPNSPCAKLVRRALEGNPDAVTKLRDGNPEYCELKE